MYPDDGGLVTQNLVELIEDCLLLRYTRSFRLDLDAKHVLAYLLVQIAVRFEDKHQAFACRAACAAFSQPIHPSEYIDACTSITSWWLPR